jgi:hypothetical protein
MQRIRRYWFADWSAMIPWLSTLIINESLNVTYNFWRNVTSRSRDALRDFEKSNGGLATAVSREMREDDVKCGDAVTLINSRDCSGYRYFNENIVRSVHQFRTVHSKRTIFLARCQDVAGVKRTGRFRKHSDASNIACKLSSVNARRVINQLFGDGDGEAWRWKSVRN